MAQRRLVGIEIRISVGGNGDEGEEHEAAEHAPVQRRPRPGFESIRKQLRESGEGNYADEHAARIWNGSHPEAPVPTSFDEPNGGFNPKPLPEPTSFTDNGRKGTYSSGRPKPRALRKRMKAKK